MNDENPYAPPAAERDEARADGSEQNTEAHDERLRWESTEGHVSAIGLIAYAPSLLYVFITIVLLQAPRNAKLTTSLLAGFIVFALVLAAAAHRVRKLKRDGRLVLTIFYALTLLYVFFAPFALASVVVLTPPTVALFYLWFGPGAYVLGEDHARVLAATRGRAVPTATWGYVVFGLMVAIWLVIALKVAARSG